MSIFVIRVCKVYLQCTHKIGIHSWPVKCDSSIQEQLQRGVMEEKVFLEIAVLKLWQPKLLSNSLKKNTCEVSLPAILLKGELFHSYFWSILISFQNSCFLEHLRIDVYEFTFLKILIFFFFQDFLVIFSLKRYYMGDSLPLPPSPPSYFDKLPLRKLKSILEPIFFT